MDSSCPNVLQFEFHSLHQMERWDLAKGMIHSGSAAAYHMIYGDQVLIYRSRSPCSRIVNEREKGKKGI
jgi:hypothetical protein